MDMFKVFDPTLNQYSVLLSAADANTAYMAACQGVLAKSGVAIIKVFMQDNGDQAWSATSAPDFDVATLAANAVAGSQYKEVVL